MSDPEVPSARATQPDCFECKYGGLAHPCRHADGRYDFAKVATALIDHGRSVRTSDLDPGEASALPSAWPIDCIFELLEDHSRMIPSLVLAAMEAASTPEDADFIVEIILGPAVTKFDGAKLDDGSRPADAHEVEEVTARFCALVRSGQGGAAHAELVRALMRAFGR